MRSLNELTIGDQVYRDGRFYLAISIIPAAWLGKCHDDVWLRRVPVDDGLAQPTFVAVSLGTLIADEAAGSAVLLPADDDRDDSHTAAVAAGPAGRGPTGATCTLSERNLAFAI